MAKELLEVEEGEIEVTLDEMLRTNGRDPGGRSHLSAALLFFRKRLRKAAAGTFGLPDENL